MSLVALQRISNTSNHLDAHEVLNYYWACLRSKHFNKRSTQQNTSLNRADAPAACEQAGGLAAGVAQLCAILVVTPLGPRGR